MLYVSSICYKFTITHLVWPVTISLWPVTKTGLFLEMYYTYKNGRAMPRIKHSFPFKTVTAVTFILSPWKLLPW